MSVLTDYWAEYKVIENSGQGRTKRALELEELIHQRQKEMMVTPYDFDARWERMAKNATPTLTGPPSPDSKPFEIKTPVSKIEFDEVKKRLGGNDCALLDHAARVAEDKMIYLAYVLDKINPDNTNVARRGQAINLAMGIYNKLKDNNVLASELNG